MHKISPPENPELSLDKHQQPFFDVVGILPATDRTPDIYYCDDVGSEKVALLTFLTIWFLDAPIQAMIKDRSPYVICGLSPLAGGARLEQMFRQSHAPNQLMSGISQFNIYASNESYAGRCYQPEWSADTGAMIKPGLLAIYAVSSTKDEKRQYTQRQQSKLRRQFEEGKIVRVAEEDDQYRIVTDRPFKNGMMTLCEAIRNCSGDLDRHLAELLSEGFWDIDDLFDKVPAITVHEIGYLLKHNTGICPTEAIEAEANARIKRKDALSYYRRPWETVAELAGIKLLQDVRKNAGLNYGLPTSGLDLILPNSYADIETELQRIKDTPELKREP